MGSESSAAGSSLQHAATESRPRRCGSSPRALHTVGVGRLQLFVAPENLPALRLAENAGFRREGLFRSYWDDNGTRLDALVLSRLPGDGPLPGWLGPIHA